MQRTGDIRKDLTESQLAGVGSVALAYNEAEILIDILMSLALGIFTFIANDVTGRINGIDGKIEIAKKAMKLIAASDEVNKLLSETLGDGGFSLYKKYRDAVIHARILDAPAGIGLSPARRGEVQEVLLTASALNGLYDRLVIIRLELIEACNIAIRSFSDRRWTPLRALLDPSDSKAYLPKRQYEQEIQACLSRYREHQKRRLLLPPLPEFPEEPPVPQSMEEYGVPPG